MQKLNELTLKQREELFRQLRIKGTSTFSLTSRFWGSF